MNYTSASHLITCCNEPDGGGDVSSSVESFYHLRGPCSCAVNKEGTLVVCEWRGHSLAIVNPNGETVRRFGNKDPTEDVESLQQFRGIFRSPKQSSSQLFGTKIGELHEPTGVAVTSDNHIAVCDSQNNRVQLFQFSGTPVAVASKNTGGMDNFTHPHDIVIDRNSGLMRYVSHPFKHRITVLTAEMTFSHEIAKRGQPGRTFTPLGVAVDSENKLYVCDRDNSAVQKLSRFGDPITTYKADHLNYPVRVAVDSNGIVYATYAYVSEIAMFSNEGQYIGRFGGDCETVQKLRRPRGIAVGAEKIYICDTANNQVVIL